jgi:hypothetical protein
MLVTPLDAIDAASTVVMGVGEVNPARATREPVMVTEVILPSGFGSGKAAPGTG